MLNARTIAMLFAPLTPILLASSVASARPTITIAPGSVPSALIAAIERDLGVASCVQSAHGKPGDFARKFFGFDRVELGKGKIVYSAQGGGPCAGNDNDLFYAFLQGDGGAFRKVVATAGFGELRSDGAILIRSHESAAIQGRVMYVFNGKAYRLAEDDLSCDDENASPKPVRFAAGASSATVTGNVACMDDFEIDAAAGQTMTVTVRPERGRLGPLSVWSGTPFLGGGSEDLSQSAPGTWTGTLPVSGRYTIQVSAYVDAKAVDAKPKPTAYTMTIAIH